MPFCKSRRHSCEDRQCRSGGLEHGGICPHSRRKTKHLVTLPTPCHKSEERSRWYYYPVRQVFHSLWLEAESGKVGSGGLGIRTQPSCHTDTHTEHATHTACYTHRA